MRTFKLFIAPWCFEQCSSIMTSLLDVEEEFGIEFDIINAEENYEVAKVYGINAVPTVVVEEDGEVVATYVADAYFNPTALEKFLEGTTNVGR